MWLLQIASAGWHVMYSPICHAQLPLLPPRRQLQQGSEWKLGEVRTVRHGKVAVAAEAVSARAASATSDPSSLMPHKLGVTSGVGCRSRPDVEEHVELPRHATGKAVMIMAVGTGNPTSSQIPPPPKVIGTKGQQIAEIRQKSGAQAIDYGEAELAASQVSYVICRDARWMWTSLLPAAGCAL